MVKNTYLAQSYIKMRIIHRACNNFFKTLQNITIYFVKALYIMANNSLT